MCLPLVTAVPNNKSVLRSKWQTNKFHSWIWCVCTPVCFICSGGMWWAFRAPWWATSQSQSTSPASSWAASTTLTTSPGPCTSASPISRTCPSSSPSTGLCSVVSSHLYVGKMGGERQLIVTLRKKAEVQLAQVQGGWWGIIMTVHPVDQSHTSGRNIKEEDANLVQ